MSDTKSLPSAVSSEAADMKSEKNWLNVLGFRSTTTSL